MKIKEYIIILDEDSLFLHIEDELVRCKECKYWEIKSNGFGECNVMDKQLLGREYCSFGERKE